MSRKERFRFPHGRAVASAYRHITEAHEHGVVLNHGQSPNGRELVVDGHSVKNFGSCSYLALEGRPELRRAAHEAIDIYGTQFSFSRAYVQCPLYVELEAALEEIAGRPALVAASTTLAHLAALPVLVEEGDVILIDQFAHASLHTALQLVPTIPVEIVRHNRMDNLEAAIERLKGSARHIWYLADGVYSMLGDLAPFDALNALLARHPQLHLYVDDAHGTSWAGQHGRGVARSRLAEDDRVVVALSLNKAFSAAGGALTLAEHYKTKIRRCGGTMIFSGPIQPPMLGAALASARLHLASEFGQIQSELDERIDIALAAIVRAGLNVVDLGRTPIFHVQVDSPRVAFSACTLLKQRGYYCSPCTFPAVPLNRPGLRFTVSRHNDPSDIEPFVLALKECVAEALDHALTSAVPGPRNGERDTRILDVDEQRVAVG